MKSCKEILNDVKYKKYQTAGYYNQPFNSSSQFGFLPATVLPEIYQTLKESYKDFKDNKLTGEEILKKRKDGLINAAGIGTFGLLNTLGNNQYYKNSLQRQQQLNTPNYVETPYDQYSYNSSGEDMYKAYQAGGLKKDITIQGYKADSPYVNKPYNDIYSPTITMNGVNKLLVGIADTGEKKMMYPGMNYNFPGAKVVREIPLSTFNKQNEENLKKYQTGGDVEDDVWGQYDYTSYENPLVEENNEEEDYFNEDDLMFTVPETLKERVRNKRNNQEINFDVLTNDSIRRENSNNQKGQIHKVVDDFKAMGYYPSSVESGKHNVGSKHGSGNAADFGLNSSFGGDINKLKQFKQWFETSGKFNYPGLKLIDETVRPNGQKVWNGSHLHFEYGNGGLVNNSFNRNENDKLFKNIYEKYQTGGITNNLNDEPITKTLTGDALDVSAKFLYDYQKTNNYSKPLNTINDTNFIERSNKIAKDYVEYQKASKENRLRNSNFENLEIELAEARANGNQEEVSRLESILEVNQIVDQPHLDCLGSSCMYTDRYFKKDYDMPGMNKIKERLLKYTDKNDAKMAAWNIFGALKKDNPAQIDWSLPPQKDNSNVKSKYNDLPQDVKDKIVVGSNIGFFNNGSRDGINEEEGIQDTRHHAIVIGFDKDKTPILYDYGQAKRIDNPTFDWNIGAIATPDEYRERNINAENYTKTNVGKISNVNKYFNKNAEDKDINEVSKSFIDNKDKIKKDLDLNDYDYNRLASYLLASSQQETHDYNFASKANDFFASAKKNPSLGIFQIKLENAKEIVRRYNLPANYATKSALKDPYKSAIIGMYLAADIDKSKENWYKQGLKSQENIPVKKSYINIPVLNKISKTENITTKGNSELTENEKFFYSWNSPYKLKTGQAQGDSNYVKQSKKYLENVGIDFLK